MSINFSIFILNIIMSIVYTCYICFLVGFLRYRLYEYKRFFKLSINPRNFNMINEQDF